MAHYAKVENGVVTQVLKADRKFVDTLGGTWLRTSYNMRGGVHKRGLKPLRKNFAGVGYSYIAEIDAFVAPRPFASWLLNGATGLWEPPIAYPADGKNYNWDEIKGNWSIVNG